MSDLPSVDTDGPIFTLGALAQSDRQQIVDLAGNGLAGSEFLEGDDLTLSALGANLDLKGTWKTRLAKDGIPATNLVAWHEVMQQGRENHVKLVYAGYLFPLGHKATLTTVTNRLLVPDLVSPGQYADAYLQQHSYIRVTQQLKTYPAPGQPYGEGAWPFVSAKILTEVTPDLQPKGTAFTPDFITAASDQYPQAFFPTTLEGDYFPFNVHLVDGAGTTVSIQVPLVFFFATAGTEDPINQYNAADPKFISIMNTYNALGRVGSDQTNLVTSAVAGTPILFAPEVYNNGVVKQGATTHPTLSITLGAASPTTVPTPTAGQVSGDDQYVPPVASPMSQATLTSNDQPAFYPTLLSANVRLPAAETLSRSSFDDGSGPGGVTIFLYGTYITDGFTKGAVAASLVPHTSPVNPAGSTNPGSVYAGLLNQPGLNFPADMVGGLANPNLGVQGLSAAAGAIGGTLSQYASKAQALISEYFGDLTSSNFLGGLSLSDILGDFLGDTAAPEITRQIASDGTITVTYTLQTTLSSFPSGSPVFVPVSDDGNFTLTATVVVTPKGSTTFDVNGEVDGFTITILGDAPIIQIPFGTDSTPGATFSTSTGKKSSIAVNVGQPSFLGALDFVNTLEQFLSDIGGSGISIDVGPTQISASISLSLPSVGCGVFNLENLALSASVVVPFLGGATIATFGFCSVEQPFSLTVMCFGGGGYLLVSVGLYSLQSLTASFDFEGQLALDLGVASGSISAMAGITFSYTAGQGSTLSGFVRLTGEVEVLGILSVTIELQLTLSYSSASNVATGTATMTISVSLCFFSISVPITVQKSFAGPGGSSPHLREISGHSRNGPEGVVPHELRRHVATQFCRSDGVC
jgi:hypothetical protein